MKTQCRALTALTTRLEKMKRFIPVVLMTLLALASLRPAAAQTNGYTVTDLGLLSGATASEAKGINDSGSVVGNATIPIDRLSNGYKGWLWTPGTPNAPSGTLRALESLAGQDRTGATDVNNAGLIVGGGSFSTSVTTSAGPTAIFWQGPNYAPTEFNSLPRDPALAGWSFVSASFVSDPVAGTGEIYVAGRGHYVAADGSAFDTRIVWRMDAAGVIVGVTTLNGSPSLDDMNNRGQVISYVQSAVGYDAFLWDGLSGTGTNLGTLGGTSAFGKGINDNGTVVGRSTTTAGLRRGFVWTPTTPNGTQGTMTALGTLGGTSSFAYGINNLNQIVGSSYLKGDRTKHACFWQNGATTPTDLNTLKFAGATALVLEEAYRVNNKGGIIGKYANSKGSRAFLLTPR